MKLKMVAVCTLIVATGIWACNSDSGSDSGVMGPSVTSSSSATSSTAPAPAPAVAPTPSPNQNPLSATADAQGNVTINNTGAGRYEGQICYYWNGPHPQTLAQEPTEVNIVAGHSKSFPFPDLTFEVEGTDCSVTKDIQLDVGFIKCTNSNSANLARAGVKPSDLHLVAYIDVVKEGEGEWQVVGEPVQSETEWGECQIPEIEASTDVQQQCFKEGTYTVTTTEVHTCTKETRTKTEEFPDKSECKCPITICIPKPDGDPVLTYSDWVDIDCDKVPPTVNQSTVEEICYDCTTRTETTTQNYTCKEPPVVTTKPEFDKKEVPCTCVVEWIPGPEIRENETGYGLCEQGAPEFDALTQTKPPTADCPGHKSRTVDIVIYETNSCTQEVREKSRINIEEQDKCVAQCEQAFCHTERARWVITKLMWQCQNVPPGTPGHYPNHFNWPHGDFFGECTEEKCYSITN